MDTAHAPREEAAIQSSLDNWLAAVRTMDVDRIMAHYAPDVVAFDAIQQLQFKGLEAYRQHWEACLSMCPGPSVFELHDVDIKAEGSLGVVYGLLRCGMVAEDGSVDASWMRMTSSVRYLEGKWLITHEHFSAPIDMQTGRALFDLDPAGATKARPIPLGMTAITPQLVCSNGGEAIDFYERAFGATQEARLNMPDGKLAHACLRIGGAAMMLTDECPEYGSLSPVSLEGTPVTVHLYVQNVDAAFEKAVAAGARAVMPVQEMFWGDRYGVLEDPFGHRWSLATHVRDLSLEEIEEGARKMMGASPECASTAPSE